MFNDTFLGANTISNTFLQIPEAEMALVALSPSIFFVSVIAVIKGYFNGRENITVTARSQSLEQVFKTVFTIIIVNSLKHNYWNGYSNYGSRS